MTRAEILADLKVMIGKGIEVSDNELYTWINDGYGQIIDKILEINPDYFAKTSLITSVAGTKEYALPTDFESMIMVNVQNDGVWYRYQPLPNVGYVEAHSQRDSYTVASPRYYLFGSYIGLDPTPAVSVTDGIKLWYKYTPTELIADSSTPVFPNRYHHLIKFWAYSIYLDRDDEHVSAERLRQRFDGMVGRMTDNMFGTQIDQPKSVEIVNNIDMF